MNSKNYIEASTIESECFDYRIGMSFLRFDYRRREAFSDSTIESEKMGQRRPQPRMDIGSQAFRPEVERRRPSDSTIEDLCIIATPNKDCAAVRTGGQP
jgi:hypothetical protein